VSSPEARLKRLGAVAGLGALALLWGELVNWRSSWRLVGTAPSDGASEAVVVLGFRNPGRRANGINRWRVRAGLRSQDPRAARTCLVLCGGGRPGHKTEAALMADYARRVCGYQGELRLEELSRSTWENIEYAAPLLEEAERIKIVSNPMHAERGRIYLQCQRPDLAARVVRGADYRFGEWMPLKPVAAVLDLRTLARARRDPAALKRWPAARAGKDPARRTSGDATPR